jgi:hypothetical protein
MHWAEARGLSRRYAAGPTMRLKIIKKPTVGLFFGTGPIYEFEEWNYNAVATENLPQPSIPLPLNVLKMQPMSVTNINYFPKFLLTSVFIIRLNITSYFLPHDWLPVQK